MTLRQRRLVFWGGIAVLLAAALAWAFRPQPVPVDLAVVERGRLTVTVDVTNTGKRAGDEVVQLYLHDVLGSVTRPTKQLRGFRRIHLAAGENVRVELPIRADDLALYDRDMKRVIEPGRFDVLVGASSADIRQRTAFEVIKRAR